jgi:Protein of unknown function (DUF4238)
MDGQIMPKDRTRKGHFIPRFLLRNFTTTDKPEHIWAVRVDTRELLRPSLSNVASERDMYDAPDDGGADLPITVEQLLATTHESYLASAVAEVVESRSIQARHRFRIAGLAALQFLRGPRTRDSFKAKLDQVAKQTMAALARDRRAFMDLVGTRSPDGAWMSTSEIEQLRRGILSGSVNIHGDRLEAIWIALAQLRPLTEALAQMDWVLFGLEEGGQFLIADHPVWFRNPRFERPIRTYRDLIGDHTNLHLPLAPQLCAVGNGTGMNGYEPQPPIVAELFNREAIALAERFVFMADPNPHLVDLIRRVTAQGKVTPPGMG